MPGLRSLPRMLVAGTAVLGLATALGGCSHTVSAGNRHLVQLALTEYRLAPGSLRVQAGELTIVVRNLGRLTHNLVLSRGEQAEARTVPLAPGARGQLAVIVTPGTYVLDSSLFSDHDLGLYGTLTVSG